MTEIPFSSNNIQLTARHWLIVLVIVTILFSLTPVAFQQIETFHPGANYRIPYSLSNDYYHFHRYCKIVCATDKTLIIGDSVMWGPYVAPDQTLAGCLNQLAGADRFANLAVDGLHPLALTGLIEYYGSAITGKNVILHLNLLWLNSPRADLQDEKESSFNHPRLVPQFFPRIPSYNATASERIGIVIERNSSFSSWTSHLLTAYFDSRSLPGWTLDNPYACPASQITLQLPPPADEPHDKPIPWNQRSPAQQNLPWVDLDTSVQWPAFCRLIKLLQNRHNRIFILVGPLNTHILTPQSQTKYQNILTAVENYLTQQNLPYLIPPTLPANLYADTSHPLPPGYQQIAQQLFDQVKK